MGFNIVNRIEKAGGIFWSRNKGFLLSIVASHSCTVGWNWEKK